MRIIFSFIFSLFLSLNVLAFPELTDGVVDEANILSEQTKQTILQLFKQEDISNVVVATVNSLEGKPIEQYATELGNYWEIGSAKYNNGVLLLIAPNEGYVRIATGLGMEKYFTDSAAEIVIQNWMMPYLRDRNFDMAALQGVNGILVQIKGITAFPNKSHTGEQVLTFILWGTIILILGIALYVLSAPPGNKKDRLNKALTVVCGALGIIFLIFIFLGRFIGKGGKGGHFSGGGHFGGGGATGKF